ncbi:hypothetical protein AGR4A_Cc180030 [Agrobacterium tumefaciens str. B6]|uniref:Uncharacterized protein n=1 Tax=Agrobacterium tumefaciens str. B6 TaxID=1183423 RepID=A0A822UYC7_AGRTU|nr:hypothetical protein AGR4A_Cc180030 [Agrobacterium tumefaciens str. B6]
MLLSYINFPQNIKVIADGTYRASGRDYLVYKISYLVFAHGALLLTRAES